MKMKSVLTAAALLLCFVPFATQSRAADTKAFLGRWDLTLKAPDHEAPSWIDIKEVGGKLLATFVGRWSDARPLPKIEISGNHVKFVSPKDEESSKEDLVFDGTLANSKLTGTITGFDGAQWTWSGVRAPALAHTGTPKWGKPITLFNGKDLTGWTMTASGPPVWTVQDGTLVTPNHGPEIVNSVKAKDLKLHIEFKCDPDSNSGVYLRGRYEVQVETDSAAEPPSHHTGGVYGFLAEDPEQPRVAGKWQSYDITLIGRRITVVQNGKTVIDNKEIPGITGGALNSHEGEAGPIYLQGSEKGRVAFRNIVLTPAVE